MADSFDSKSRPAALQPLDEFNRVLESNVRPADWTNPEPTGRYNLVVIGAGTAGLVTAAGAAGLGAKVALVERELMGGDCLNVGCVPSKAILSAGHVAAQIRGADRFALRCGDELHCDFAEVMRRMRRLRSEISFHDSAARFRELGVDVFLGQGQFVDSQSVSVGGKTLRFKRAVVATGARAARLPIPGYESVEPLTNETLFSLTELPERLTVIGGGPIGTEMAQAFARLGSRVTQIEKSSHLLAREDPDAAEVVRSSLQRDGVNLLLNTEVVRFERRGDQRVTICRSGERETEIIADQILVGIGRRPNVDTLNLDAVGVRHDVDCGIEVNDRLQTSNRRIYAAGDVVSRFQFTHAADFMARIVIGNALFMTRSKLSSLLIPWCTYTSPELAHVGLSPRTARDQGVAIKTFTQRFDGVDRAILESDQEGFVRIHVLEGKDKIVGATVVGANAGDMISEITLAMQNKIGLSQIASTIHPYPTRADAIRKIGDQYNKTRLTPWVSKLMKTWLRWTR